MSLFGMGEAFDYMVMEHEAEKDRVVEYFEKLIKSGMEPEEAAIKVDEDCDDILNSLSDKEINEINRRITKIAARY